jgi:predicted permease
MVLRATRRLPEDSSKVLTGWVVNVALPAAAFESVEKLHFHPDWWLAMATPWIGIAIAVVVLLPLCRLLKWSRQRTGALLLVGGWGNTSFVGLPMIAAFPGEQWLGLGVMIDLCGSYLALSTVGIAIATIAGEGRFDWRIVRNRIATFPPFLAVVIAFATNQFERPPWLSEIFSTLAHTLTPVALAAVGFALRPKHIAGRFGPLTVGLGFRLIIAPLALVGLYGLLNQTSDPVAKVAMLEMAMPPMVGASIIAADNELEPDLIALILGLGVPLSMLTVWGWWSLIAPL